MRTTSRRRFRLLCLGAIDLRSADGEPVSALLAQPRRFAVLVYLTLAQVTGLVRRASLAATFWPESDETHALGALRQTLRFLRLTLGGDAIRVSSAHDVGIVADEFWCDVTAFEQAFACGDADAAVALYRGDLLDGFHIDAAPAFDEWMELRRARLAREFAAAIERLATGYAIEGKTAAAIECWRTLVARAPESGHAVLGLMRALEAAGDRAAALAFAERQRVILARDYRAPLDTAVRALVEQLRGQR